MILTVRHEDAFPQFRQKYGEQLPDGTYQVPAPWQAGLSNGANVGEIIGLFLNGFISERFGYRYTVMACLTLIIGFTAIFFTAKDVVSLQVAEVLCGIPWGVFRKNPSSANILIWKLQLQLGVEILFCVFTL